MANSMKGVVDVELGDANRQIKFDFNAICALEEYFGKSAAEIFNTEDGTIEMRTIRGAMWVGLQRHHPGVEIEDVGQWLGEAIEENRFEDVSNKLGEALSQALGGKASKEAPGKNPEPPTKGATKKGSTSKNSSGKPGASA